MAHRGLKPENILVANVEGKRIYKLTDFGSAKYLAPNEKYTSIHGTVEFNHPFLVAHQYGFELENEEPIDGFDSRFDMWSLGVTLYSLATGKLPFEPLKGRNDPKTMFKMMNDKKDHHISAQECEGKVVWSSDIHCAIFLPFHVGILFIHFRRKICGHSKNFRNKRLFCKWRIGSVVAVVQRKPQKKKTQNRTSDAREESK